MEYVWLLSIWDGNKKEKEIILPQGISEEDLIEFGKKQYVVEPLKSMTYETDTECTIDIDSKTGEIMFYCLNMIPDITIEKIYLIKQLNVNSFNKSYELPKIGFTIVRKETDG